MSASPHPSSAALIGQQVDRYVLEQEIGSGGFGAVYRARHSVLGTTVALKLLWPSHLTSPEIVQRFVQEARAAASIGHPHIIQVLDAGQASEGMPFLVMEHLRGRDLESLLAERRMLDVETAIELGVQVLDALAAAHARQIVHRDLKPANVFVTTGPDGRPFVKLLDFGISKVLGAGGTLTQTGSLLGTPHYMAPEQLDGARGLDARADLFAVGVMLYRALAGALPMEGEGYSIAIRRLQGEKATPLRERAPHVPAAVAQIVMRAMELDAAFRWPSATAMADALIEASAQLLPGGAAVNVATAPPARMPGPATGAPGGAHPHGGPHTALSPSPPSAVLIANQQSMVANHTAAPPAPHTGPAATPHPWLVANRPASVPPRSRTIPGYVWAVLGASVVLGAIGLGAMVFVGVRALRASDASEPRISRPPAATPPILGRRGQPTDPIPLPSLPMPGSAPPPAPAQPEPAQPEPAPAHAAGVRYTIVSYVGMGPRTEIQAVFERARVAVARCGRADRAHDVSVEFIATTGGAITISRPSDERPSSDPDVAHCVASAIPSAGPARFDGMQTAIVTVDVHVPAL